MSEMNHSKMIEIFRTVFFDLEGKNDTFVVNYSKSSSSVWDSAAHLLLLTCIEESFGTRVNDEDALLIDSFKLAVAIVT